MFRWNFLSSTNPEIGRSEHFPNPKPKFRVLDPSIIYVFALFFYFQETVNRSASPNKDNKNEEKNSAAIKNQDEENRIDQAAIEASQKLNPV